MQSVLSARAEDWLFGNDRRQRNRLRRTLVASGVYWLAAIGQLWSVRIGLADPRPAAALVACLVPGLGGFYLLLRSGATRRLADPALTLPQMAYAIAVMAAAYLINPPLRGMLLMIVALVLMFAAFTLEPKASRLLGWIAVAVLGAAMAAGATLDPRVFDPTIERIHFAFAAGVLPVIALLAADLSSMRLRLKRQKADLQDALSRIHELATRDDLTGLVNRRRMEELAEREHRRALRGGRRPCLCLVDLDHFKRINDRHGHAAGDEVLRIFARQAEAAIRETDVLARWGGEEFLVLLPDTDPAEAQQGLERLRQRLGRDETWGAQLHLRVSFSAGLTAWRGGEALRDALARADLALYEAKATGRGRIVRR
jgi:diguanylate cyclase (GGDEF)-like protein